MFISPDSYVQAPDLSQNLNRYSYCLNNPLTYTDPTGYWFGIDEAIAAGLGFVVGYASYGIATGNFGWKAIAAGGVGAAVAWVGWNTMGCWKCSISSYGNVAAQLPLRRESKRYLELKLDLVLLSSTPLHLYEFRHALRAIQGRRPKGMGGVLTFGPMPHQPCCRPVLTRVQLQEQRVSVHGQELSLPITFPITWMMVNSSLNRCM
jgi:hypothetical protein